MIYKKIDKSDLKNFPSINICDLGETQVINNNIIDSVNSFEVNPVIEKLLLETYANKEHHNQFYSDIACRKYDNILNYFWKRIIIVPCCINGKEVVQYTMLKPNMDKIAEYVEGIISDKVCDKQLFRFAVEKKDYAAYQGGDFSRYYQVLSDMKNENFSNFEKAISEYLSIIPHFTLDILGYTIDELLSDKEFQHICNNFKLIYLFFYSDRNCILHIFA